MQKILGFDVLTPSIKTCKIHQTTQGFITCRVINTIKGISRGRIENRSLPPIGDFEKPDCGSAVFKLKL